MIAPNAAAVTIRLMTITSDLWLGQSVPVPCYASHLRLSRPTPGRCVAPVSVRGLSPWTLSRPGARRPAAQEPHRAL